MSVLIVSRGLAALALLLAQIALAQLAAAAGTSRALLIGINQYKAVPSLQGSVNDVETIRQVLATRWGFPPANIELLVGEAATRDGMLQAFNRLVAAAGPDDTVYIHYSGHGSQVQDLNGDEADGLDETLVPQDGRSGNIPDIVDDELDSIFSKLHARSTVIVFDSCHSGTATRAVGFRTRSLPQDTRIDLYRSGTVATTSRAIVPLAQQSRFVLMTGAADNQEALDGPIDGRYHGFFSYALSRSFTAAPMGASPRDIFAGVAHEFGRIQATFGRSSMPEPQLEAPPQSIDAPLFAPTQSGAAAAQTARLSWLTATPSGPGAARLANGLLLGATAGSTWAIYGPNETQFLPGRALAVATVTATSGSDANATLDRDITVPPSSRAIALLPAPANGRIALRWLDDPGAARARIEGELSQKIPGVEWVGPDQPARFLVGMQGHDVRLMTADGLAVVARFAVGDDRAVADVARIVSRTTPAAELLALDNPGSRLRVTARVAADERPMSRDIRLVADTSSMRLVSRRPGEPRGPQNSLQLAVSVSEDAFLTIVDVDTEGRVNLLFPNPYQRPGFHADGAVRGGVEVLIPDSLQSGNGAGFYWDYGPPPGSDTLRVFATTDLDTSRMIRNRIVELQQAPPPDGTVSRAIPADFTPLRSDLSRAASRGISVVAGDEGYSSAQPSGAPADWAATSVSVFVEE